MFTEGLDSNALRWVRQNEKEALPHSGLRPAGMETLGNIRGSRGFGLPPASKFRSGHLPETAIPVSVTGEDSRSDSDGDDMSTEEEEEVYGGRYSVESSPRNPNYAAGEGYRAAARRGLRYQSSDYGYSDEVSSSMETVVVGRKPGNVVEYSGEEGEEDSGASSELSRRNNNRVGGDSDGGYGYASSSVASRATNVGGVSAKDLHFKNVQKPKAFHDADDVASAPPFCGHAQEIKEDTEVSSEVHKATPGVRPSSVVEPNDSSATKNHNQFSRTASGPDAAITSGSNPTRLPNFYASALGPWHAVVAYDACARLCLHAWARGCMEAPMFLENECALLREAFSVKHMLLQSEEELLANRSSEPTNEGAAPKPKKVFGKIKVQVRKVKTVCDPPTGCSMSSLKAPKLKMVLVQRRFSKFQSGLCTVWKGLRKVHVAPHLPAKGSFSRQSLAYVHASTQYIKQVSGLLKTGVTSLRNSSSSYEVVQETYLCTLRLKSSAEQDAIRMQPGSGEAHVFFPDSLGDDLIVEVQDSKGKHYGRVVIQVATVAEDPVDKLRWWSMYREPEHELVGKLQLFISYSTSSDDSSLKCGSVAETVAYDIVLEVAMKVQHFQQRNLLLYGSWKWLLTEFAAYYGVSDIYTKLRYLSYIMDVATPTADCLTLVHDLLMPVIMKGHSKSMLSYQENRILAEIKDQIEQILSLVFENYKSLDESTFSGIMDVFKPATGVVAPALEPAVKLYMLLHDILSPEAQTNLTHYFQVAAKKRSRKHLAETEEFVNVEAALMDPVSLSAAYKKMTSLCLNFKNEIYTDIEIHNRHILPSFIDLPNISSSIYSTELCGRLRTFLIACPPSGPSPPVAELVIATADFQRDLASWNISIVKGGVDAKELFHLYIMLWIQDKRLVLLESCKLDKVKWSGVRTQHSTTPFVDEMYDRLRATLDDYEVIIRRWPEYIFALENAVADVEKAVIEALDKQYTDVLAPLKENLTPKKFGLKYVKKLTKRSVCSYTVPDELGILLNSMKRMLDTLRPRIEAQFKSWGSCIPLGGNAAPGDRLSEVTVMLRAKFRGYIQAVVEKLAENTKLQNVTKMKKILQESKESVVESDIRSRMQPLKEQLVNTISHLHSVFETHVFIAICRGYWDQMGQDVLSFLENRKENRSWYKGSRIAVSVLDDTFASQMQQLLGNALQQKDLEPPRSVMEVRSMLCKDASNHKSSNYYF